MKTGDKGFFYHERNVELYVEIGDVTEEGITFHVINGNWNYKFEKADVPKKVAGNYNAAIEWFKDELRNRSIPEKPASVEEDNEIPF